MKNVYKLDGLWKFKIDPKKEGEDKKWNKTFPADGDKIYVPSCWGSEIKYFDYFGDAWYETVFALDSDDGLLRFNGILNSCVVYIDGEKAGEYYGSFGEYVLLLRGLGAGAHKLTVKVNNETNDVDTLPKANVDWYHHGGLFRSVEVQSLHDCYVDKFRVSYALDDALTKATVTVTANVSALKKQKSFPVRLTYVGKEIYNGETADGTFSFTFEETSVELWSSENPKLYNVTLQIGRESVFARVGFRKFEIKDGKFYFNGKRFIFRGFNRHEETVDFGFAVPFALNKRDIDIMRMANANFVRFSHYPVHKETLEYCDEIGMLVWEEVPLWGATDTSLKSALLRSRVKAMHKGMVERDWNHACIVVWGLHNEIDTRCEEGVSLTQELYALNKQLDGTRLTTYATMYAETDSAVKYCDFLSLNKYIGWYQDGGLSLWDVYFDRVHKNLQAHGCEGLALIVSEFGLEGLHGETSFYESKWLESTQNKIAKETVEYFFSREDLQGVLYWQFCDTRTSKEFALNRVRGLNNKGCVTEYRQPKSTFFTLQAIYGGLTREDKTK